MWNTVCSPIVVAIHSLSDLSISSLTFGLKRFFALSMTNHRPHPTLTPIHTQKYPLTTALQRTAQGSTPQYFLPFTIFPMKWRTKCRLLKHLHASLGIYCCEAPVLLLKRNHTRAAGIEMPSCMHDWMKYRLDWMKSI